MLHLFREAWCLLETIRPLWIAPRSPDGPLTEVPITAGGEQFTALDDHVDSQGIVPVEAVLNFDLQGLGIHMPRRRSQVGWVQRDGKSWIGYAYRYELLENGEEKRRVKQHTVAKCADMTKAEALTEHLRWVAGLDHAPQAAAPSTPHTLNELWERYKKLKEESGARGKHHASTLRAVMKHWVLCTIGDADVAALQVDDLIWITPKRTSGSPTTLPAAGSSKSRRALHKRSMRSNSHNWGAGSSTSSRKRNT